MAITTLGDSFRVVIEGGAGARFASIAEGFANDAEAFAADAAGFSGAVYANQAAGEAATSVGEFFLVWNGDTPRTYTHYERTSGGSAAASPPLTAAALSAATGAELVGRPQGNLSAELDQWVDIGRYPSTATGFRSAVEAAMSSGKTLYMHGARTIDGWASKLDTTATLTIRGDGPLTTRLTFTGESASLIHLIHDLDCEGVAFIAHTANTSSNGGSIFYNVVADAGATPLNIRIKNCHFAGCKAPINFEDKFDSVEIDGCVFSGGTGHQIRTGTTTGFAAWSNWKDSTIRNCRFLSISAIAANQNVFATLQYGIHVVVDGNVTIGVTGDGTGESHAHYAKSQIFRAVNNRVSGISGGAVRRGITNKGETDSRYAVFEGNHVDGGGTADCYACYGGEAVYANNTALNPENACFAIGSLSGNGHSKFIGNQCFGSGTAGTMAYSASHDDGKLSFIGGSVSGFPKVMSINCSTGATELHIDLDCDTNTGPIEVYTTNQLPLLTLKGSARITNNNYAVWLRGPGGIARVVNKMSHLESDGGYGVYYDTQIDDLVHEDIGMKGHPTGRDVSFATYTPKAMNLRQRVGVTTTSGAVTKVFELPLADGQTGVVGISAASTDSTDNAGTNKMWAVKASGGTAALEGAEEIIFQRRSAGASAWDCTATFSANKAQVNVNGATGKTVKHVALIEATVSSI